MSWRRATPRGTRRSGATMQSIMPPTWRATPSIGTEQFADQVTAGNDPAIQRSLPRKTPMAEAATKVKPEVTAAETEQELTDGFHLIIDALKLNGIKTIYGVPGIPITDFGRMAQAAGIRVISFRHEQNAGNAAAIAGFLNKA